MVNSDKAKIAFIACFLAILRKAPLLRFALYRPCDTPLSSPFAPRVPPRSEARQATPRLLPWSPWAVGVVRAIRSFPDGLAGAFGHLPFARLLLLLTIATPRLYQAVSDIPFRSVGVLCAVGVVQPRCSYPRRAAGVLVTRRMARLLYTSYDWL